MARTCAFCDRERPLTREHVWPECFLEKVGRTSAHFSIRSQTVHGADYVVADVCRECNSTLLSPLDAYLCRLFDEYFVELRDFDSVVSFRFEYDLLVRMLLKIAYNSARSAGSDLAALRPMRRYVLGQTDRPPLLAAFLEIVSPSVVPPNDGGDQPTVVMPQMYRSAVTQVMTPNGGRVQTRCVAVYSFYFHLVLPLTTTRADEFWGAVDDLGRLVQGVVLLEPGRDEVVVRSSPQDGLRSMRPHLEAHQEQYERFFARRREGEMGE